MRVLLFLALVACSPPPDCETACGMSLQGSDDCAGFRAAEARVIEAFAPLYRPREACLVGGHVLERELGDVADNPTHRGWVEAGIWGAIATCRRDNTSGLIAWDHPPELTGSTGGDR